MATKVDRAKNKVSASRSSAVASGTQLSGWPAGEFKSGVAKTRPSAEK
jgi:hypothetical protein